MPCVIGAPPSPARGRTFVLVSASLILALAAVLGARTAWVRFRGSGRGNGVQQRAFYFWKTQWSGSPALAQSLAENRISRLYVRFFDIDWDEPARAALPVAPLQLSAPLPSGVEIVPVVYIANRVFLSTPYAEVEALADHVWLKIRKMAEANNLPLREVQLDCDWSDGTRTRYFHFTALLARELHKRRIQVSSTIRLHQIKYAARTGVPPVDRGMLMFYNFGALRADAPRSSIFNLKDAERYASYIATYSLPLDLALPLFSWTVHSRDSEVLGLVEKLEAQDIESTGAFRAVAPGRYKSTRALFFRGRYFLEDDELRLEETTPAVTEQAAATAARGAAGKKSFATLALFDLDERNLRHYAASDFQRILAAFH